MIMKQLNLLFKVKLIPLFLLVLGLTGIQAQNTVSVTGGNATGSGGTSSYTIGQIVYTTNTGTNGSTAQGVQQPYEISVVSGIEQAQGISLNVSAYPNPAMDFLTLKIDASNSLNIQSISYWLYDISGKLLENKKVTGIETNISMKNIPAAAYFLKVTDNNKEVKTFNIIKNK